MKYLLVPILILTIFLITILGFFNYPLVNENLDLTIPLIFIIGMWISLFVTILFLTFYAGGLTDDSRKTSAALKIAEEKSREERSASIFKNIAEELIDDRQSEWAPKTLQAWRNTLTTYAYPVIGDMPVADIDKTHIVKILRPIWLSKPDMAKKLRWRIEAVFSRAIFYEKRPANNPAQYITTPLICRHYTIDNQKGTGANMIGDNAARHIGVIVVAGHFCYRF